MYLKRLGIINYKSCQKILMDLSRDKPTTFIGINDSGKSAILKSVGLLLEPKTSFNVSSEARFTSDVSNTPINEVDHKTFFSAFRLPVFAYDPGNTLIIGEFAIEDGDLTKEFGEQASNAFKWAIESGPGESVTVLRQFSNGNAAGKYFLCLGESAPPMELWTKKDKDIQTKRKDLGITDDEIKNDNSKGRFAGFEIIRAIYKKAGFALTWAEAPSFGKDDLPLLPTYRYIDWNTSLTDITNLANDVMKSKIASSKDDLRRQATALSAIATTEVNKEFEALTSELTKDLKNITGIKAQVNFSVAEQISDIVINKTTADGDVRLESQGEGIKRQLLFAFLKWAATKGSAGKGGGAGKNLIWCFDEPEAHLYPGAQRDLFSVISSLAKSNYQILTGTHSTIFVDRTQIEEIYKVILEDKYSEVLRCKGVGDVHAALGVQNSDVLFFDKFLVVEGETEAVLIPHLYKLSCGRTLNEDCIKLIDLGGSGEYKRNKAVFEQLLAGFKKVDDMIQYVFDADTSEVGTNVSLVGKCDLEDVIGNKHWIALIERECGLRLSGADLDALRSKLDPTDKNKKFHKLLADEVVTRTSNAKYLPSKRRCAEILKEIVTDLADIPAVLSSVFSKLV